MINIIFSRVCRWYFMPQCRTSIYPRRATRYTVCCRHNSVLWQQLKFLPRPDSVGSLVQPLEWPFLNTMRCRYTPVISLLTFTLRLLNQISKWTGFRCNMRFTSKLVIHSYAQRMRNASYCELFGERVFCASVFRSLLLLHAIRHV